MRQVNDEEDDYRSRAAVHRKEKLSKGLFKLPEGETIIRILKTPKDAERESPSVWIEYYVHRNVGPKKLTLRCGKSVVDDSGPCWICKVVRLLKEKGKTKLAALLEKQRVYAVQIAVWDEDIGGLRGPLLWPMASGKSAKSCSFKVESIVASKKDYLDHKAGYNFTFERQGTGMLDTVYGKTERDDEPSKVPNQIIAKLKPFADVVLQYDPEAQKNAYYGKMKEDDEDEQPKRKPRADEDDDEEEAPKKKKAPVDEDDEDEAPPKKKKPSAADEDEEEVLEEDDAPPKKKKPAADDEEEEAPPKKKKPAVDEDDEEETPAPKKKKPAADDEDEELSFPEEDDEETTAPKKKKPARDEEEDFPEDEDEAPKKKKKPVDEDDLDDDDPKPKKKKPVDEDDDLEEPTPKKKKPAAEDDDEAYLSDDEDEQPKPSKKKAKPSDDLEDDLDEDEPKPKKKKPAVDEDEDEEEAPPKKKKKPAADDDDE